MVELFSVFLLFSYSPKRPFITTWPSTLLTFVTQKMFEISKKSMSTFQSTLCRIFSRVDFRRFSRDFVSGEKIIFLKSQMKFQLSSIFFISPEQSVLFNVLTVAIKHTFQKFDKEKNDFSTDISVPCLRKLSGTNLIIVICC